MEEWTIDVDLVMERKKTAVKDIGLALGAAGNGRIDDAGRSFPCEKDGEMIG